MKNSKIQNSQVLPPFHPLPAENDAMPRLFAN